MTTDRRRWYQAYDDPASVQARRLVVVRQRVGESLDALGSDVRRVLSLYAGEGRDLLSGLAARPGVRPETVLVELGIFGNVSERDIRGTIAAAPRMLRKGGLVIWARGRRDDHDLRPTVRRWFVEEGFAEVAYDGEPEPYGVGVGRWPGPARADGGLPERLFRFIR